MTTNRQNGSLYTKIENKIATIEFGHPNANSFPLELLERFAKELKLLSDNPEVSLILLKSEGDRAFCAGASFDELLAIETETEGNRFFNGFANLFLAMRECKKLIIGRVQGKTVGGGVGLIAACDYVFATEAAIIRLSELSLGIGPFVIAPVILRKTGQAALNELFMAPDQWKNAYWAQQKGLYARVFENSKEMDEAIEYFLEKLLQSNPVALSEMKRITWQHTEHWLEELPKNAEISGKLVLSQQTKQMLAKFKNR
ncbi:enoyl-CoA hydratase/isomerase family protein [Capnocytophaga felis]|uniref:Enoyl-CoA hydratase n=1 Tax=Capnocytophaga felis TaxID=2267611 RepID=A0A5M4BBK2_9FLAO|nr:enoyl-CoA hydratase/isomerase family protein [Capnocytophaga felis]GET46712.1 enoyl-CoA hydratase [Capnocytophaga felis]GET49530.1 enoyl-CoA hydratase [Capnocytophaga felis]